MTRRCRNCGKPSRADANARNGPPRCVHCGAFLARSTKSEADGSEAAGMIGGAALGAAIGGPYGAVVGGVLGVALGVAISRRAGSDE